MLETGKKLLFLISGEDGQVEEREPLSFMQKRKCEKKPNNY